MHKYLMEIRHYFRGYEQFTIEAESKVEAMEKAREHVKTNPRYWGGNYDTSTIRCIKKIQDKKGV